MGVVKRVGGEEGRHIGQIKWPKMTQNGTHAHKYAHYMGICVCLWIYMCVCGKEASSRRAQVPTTGHYFGCIWLCIKINVQYHSHSQQ